MPIRREHRFFYPIDWPQLSAVIFFRRAKGRCEGCGRPQGEKVFCFDDGRWWDAAGKVWRDGRGKVETLLPNSREIAAGLRVTKVVLATAHRDHDTANNADRNLAAWCQCCHILHDTPEHRRRRWLTFFQRKAMGDLFQGPYR